MKSKIIITFFIFVNAFSFAQKIYHTPYVIKYDVHYDTIYLKPFHKKEKERVDVISFAESRVCIRDYYYSRKIRKLRRKGERTSCGQDLLYYICGNFLFNETNNTLMLDIKQEATGLKIKKEYQVQKLSKKIYILTTIKK